MIDHYDSIKKQHGKITYYQSPSGDVVAKTCSKCFILLKMDAFNRSHSQIGGRDSVCRVCGYEYRLKLSLAAKSNAKKSNKKVQRPGTMKMKDYLQELEREKQKS